MELARLLEQRGFAAAAVREALSRLEREGWLDDLAAARSALRTRAERYGKSRLRRELSVRGFSEETIGDALGALDPEGEEKALSGLLAKLRPSSAGLSAEKRRGRVFRALSRRGFSRAAISAKIKGWPGGSGDRKVSLQNAEDEDNDVL